jgi:hypothetical protein
MHSQVLVCDVQYFEKSAPTPFPPTQIPTPPAPRYYVSGEVAIGIDWMCMLLMLAMSGSSRIDQQLGKNVAMNVVTELLNKIPYTMFPYDAAQFREFNPHMPRQVPLCVCLFKSVRASFSNQPASTNRKSSASAPPPHAPDASSAPTTAAFSTTAFPTPSASSSPPVPLPRAS